MSSIKLNSNKVNHLKAAVKPFNNALYDNCDSMGFFRYHVYEGKNGTIRVDLLATDVNGNVKRFLMVYDKGNITFYPELADVVYNEKRLNAIKSGFKNMINSIQSFGAPISQMFVDIVDGIDRGVMVDDSKEKGSFIVFVLGAVDQSAFYKLLDKGDDFIYRVWSSIYDSSASKPRR